MVREKKISLSKAIDQSRLNYEDENEHEIQIQFVNQSNRLEKTFLIHIEDLNESPSNLQCSRRLNIEQKK